MSTIKDEDLQTLNSEIKLKGYIDREHLMKFLTFIPSNDGKTIISEVKDWIQGLHDDPSYSTIVFPNGDINAILGDLDSYGRVSTQTIQQFKQNSNRVVAQTT
jgi:hypothetical protein